MNDKVTVNITKLIQLATKAKQLKLYQSKINKKIGEHYSKFKGQGIEFDEVRIYQNSDDIRSIDWKVTARTGTTHTKVFREERERPVFITFDSRETMKFATRGVFKSVQAANLAALIAWAAQQHGDCLGGQIFSEFQCSELKPQKGKHAVLNFLNVISNPVIAKNKTPISLVQILIRLNQHAKPGSLIYIISDFRGFNLECEQHLLKLNRHCSIILIFVYDNLEKSLPKHGKYKFTHQGQSITIDSNDNKLLFAHQEQFNSKLTHLEELARKSSISLIECNTNEDPMEILR